MGTRRSHSSPRPTTVVDAVRGKSLRAPVGLEHDQFDIHNSTSPYKQVLGSIITGPIRHWVYCKMPDKTCKQKYGDVFGPPARTLYVHVPFCKHKCHYCDFYSIPLDDATAERYLHAAGIELRASLASLASPLASVFMGAARRLCSAAKRLAELLEMIAPLTGGQTEFSVEANPGIDRGYRPHADRRRRESREPRRESFDDAQLSLLGRIHICTHDDAFAMLRRAGFGKLLT